MTDQLARLRAEVAELAEANQRLRQELDDARLDLELHRILVIRYQAVIAELNERIDHLLDQPLVVLAGEAFVGQRDLPGPCLN